MRVNLIATSTLLLLLLLLLSKVALFHHRQTMTSVITQAYMCRPIVVIRQTSGHCRLVVHSYICVNLQFLIANWLHYLVFRPCADKTTCRGRCRSIVLEPAATHAHYGTSPVADFACHSYRSLCRTS